MAIDLHIYEAIQLAKDAEQKAAAFYTDASAKTNNPMGKRLFEQLVAFEQYHYTKLTELEDSLRKQGRFISYQPRELPFSLILGVEKPLEGNKVSVMGIINMAIDLEFRAQNAYQSLAKEITDPDGKAMFERLSKEEQNHFTILSRAAESLNQRGVWEF